MAPNPSSGILLMRLYEGHKCILFWGWEQQKNNMRGKGFLLEMLFDSSRESEVILTLKFKFLNQRAQVSDCCPGLECSQNVRHWYGSRLKMAEHTCLPILGWLVTLGLILTTSNRVHTEDLPSVSPCRLHYPDSDCLSTKFKTIQYLSEVLIYIKSKYRSRCLFWDKKNISHRSLSLPHILLLLFLAPEENAFMPFTLSH